MLTSHPPVLENLSALRVGQVFAISSALHLKSVFSIHIQGSSKMICQSQHALIRYVSPASRKDGLTASRL
jgi:hypothetical protein